ncbi:MAG: putative toxin-antitoxin system toxin component, PIN family [Gammaproteobacteria bacterium RIFCSPLOWO2_02_FULL_57_10]|nr:MAG: putative toxin-antitoxin system toxin component, PIN family [Gammaproteobacteria bacterium RIFCSPLOWO2_02_FULL_57_10]
MKAEAPLAPPYAQVVVDTNVLLSAALLPQSLPALLLDHLLVQGRLVFSKASFAELEARLWKPKFDRYLSLEVRRRLLHDLDASALWVKIPAGLGARTWSRDRTDDVFIQTALAANVRRLITGDQDLLILHPLGDLHLLSPRAALDEIAGMQAPL